MNEHPAAQPTSATLQDGLAYWQRIRGHRLVPSRADLDPLHIPQLLPHVMLIDVLREPLDFSFRLIGSLLDRILASDYRGRRFSELPHMAKGNPIWDQYERVVTERRPCDGHVPYVGAYDGVPGLIEHCLMPLSRDGEAVDMIFVVSAIGPLPPGSGRQVPGRDDDKILP